MADVTIRQVDLSDEEPWSPETERTSFLGARKDLEPGRDIVRATLAIGLTALLSVIVIGAGLFVGNDTEKVEPVVQLLQTIFTPVVGLVGSAVGFYFGASAARERTSESDDHA